MFFFILNLSTTLAKSPESEEGMVARNGITVTKNGDECSWDEKKVRVNLKILFHDEKENLGRVENF